MIAGAGDRALVTAEILVSPAAGVPARAVRTLALLGDSTPVGMGDPRPGGGWRGFGPLLVESLGEPDAVRYANLSFPGARTACVRHSQLADALRMRPDLAVLLVGMNDTLRADFDAAQLLEDYDAVVASLRAVGATVLTVRFHDHSSVFWLPGSLRRALRDRIAELNAVTDMVVARHGIGCLDLHTMPGGYDRSSWSVDRLHPSELGHRLLALHFAEMAHAEGFAVPYPVSLAPGGGRRVTAAHHLLWLLFKGLPWLWRRGRDLVPYAVSIAVRDARARWSSAVRDARAHRSPRPPAPTNLVSVRRSR